MLYKLYLSSLITLFSLACTAQNYQPKGLTKLSDQQVIERAEQKIHINPKTTIFRNENGEIIAIDSILKMPDREDYAFDSYVDDSGKVVEVVLRKATLKDKEFEQKLKRAMEYQPPIKLVDVDCDQEKTILQEVFDSDQGMRADNGTINPDSDRQNLATVISLIEKCGMPTLREVDEVQMTAIWAAFQHGDNADRKKYLPLLERSAKNGDLSAAQIALMKDRILKEDGEPQVYGSQVVESGGVWVLYNLEKPETVNKRRAEVGLDPLQDYLRRWNIEFTVEQAE